MRSLFVTYFHVPLLATDRAGMVRRYQPILRALGRASDEITAVHIVPPGQMSHAQDPARLNRIQSDFWGVEMKVTLAPRRTRASSTWNHYAPGIVRPSAQPNLHGFGGPEVAAALAPLLSGAELVVAQELPAMLPIVRSGIRPARLVYDVVDLPHVVLARDAFTAPRYPGKYARLLHLPSLMGLVRRGVAMSDAALVCSDNDRARLRRIAPGARIEVTPNAIRFPEAPPGLATARTLLFLGDASYPPNHFAAERMARAIWPRVLASVPDGRLIIAGIGSDRLPSASAGLAGVEHTGFVDDLAALYAGVRVVVCPIMTGGGTRLKLVEAAAYARPIVSTRIGAEGLGFTDGEHALLRDDDAAFAAACVALLRDDAQCLRLGRAARRSSEGSDSHSVEQAMAGLLEGLLRQGGRPRAAAGRSA